MMKRLWTLLTVLVLTPLRVYDQPITLMAVLPDSVQVEQVVRFTTQVSGADSLQYAFWWQRPDSQFIQRTPTVVVAVRHVGGVAGSFQTCRIDSMVTQGRCRIEWMRGSWELHVDAWRWVRRHKYQQSIVRSFVVQ